LFNQHIFPWIVPRVYKSTKEKLSQISDTILF